MANSYRYAASQVAAKEVSRDDWLRDDVVFARESARRRPRHVGRLRAFHVAKTDRQPVASLPEEVIEGTRHAVSHSPWFSDRRERGRRKVARINARRRARRNSPRTTGRHSYVEAAYATALD